MKVLQSVLSGLRTVVSLIVSGPFGRGRHKQPRFDDWQYDAAGTVED